MNWFWVAVSSYFILATVNVADKFILEKVIPGPKTYTFLVGVTGMAAVLLSPWFLNWPGWGLFFFNWMTGAFFAGGLLFLYRALKGGEATRIFTLVGGLTPLFIVLLSLSVFSEKYTYYQWVAIALLILGTIVISSISVHHNIWFNIRKFLYIFDEHKFPSIVSSLIASLFFAMFWVGTKEAYNTQDFFSAFIWIRIGTFLTVLFLLVRRSSRREIFSEIKSSGKRKNNQIIYFGTQAMGAIGGLMQNYAVSLGSVALVTSLQGMQYALLLIISSLVTFFYPGIVKEDYRRKKTIKKVIAVILITLGLFLLAI